ncbi:MAG: hypothetical protein HY903_17525 [Deltaproteobacteria bacterium]|nr:hypothetical protein [Deltaproteobacteria bacterium]
MLFLESFVHRHELAEVIRRWMVNRPEPGDVRRIKRVVNFNSYVARIWLDHVAGEVLTTLFGATPERLPIRTKGQLKDFVVDHLAYTNSRIEEICARYRKFPEDYYRETPIDGSYYVVDVGGTKRLVGTTRIKHFRRIAEKGARRIIDFMLGRIRANADALADERARALGVPRNLLTTAPEEMVKEFAHAERRLVKSIKGGTIQSGLPVLAIPDVAGLKVIIEDSEYDRLLEALRATGHCQVLEAERHRGLYNAVNLRVAFTIPRNILASCPPTGRYLRILAFRGFDPEKVAAEYQEFLRTAEDAVIVEVIVSTFQEYMESEIGRCMHEERVLSQRAHREYNSHVAMNVRWLMDYILGLCRGPGMPEVTDVPIKLWVKYMPDTIEHLMRSLYLSDDVFFDTMIEPPPTPVTTYSPRSAPPDPSVVTPE